MPIIKRLLKEYKGMSIVIGTSGKIMTALMNYYDRKYGYEFWASTSIPDIYKLIFSNEKFIEVKRTWEQDHAK